MKPPTIGPITGLKRFRVSTAFTLPVLASYADSPHKPVIRLALSNASAGHDLRTRGENHHGCLQFRLLKEVPDCPSGHSKKRTPCEAVKKPRN